MRIPAKHTHGRTHTAVFARDMKLKVISSSGRTVLPEGIVLPSDAKVSDLKKIFHEMKRAYYPTRQRFTTVATKDAPRGVALEDAKALRDYGLVDGDTIVFKDLGPQVSYKAVFFFEYLGPLLAYLPFYFARETIYGKMLGFKDAGKAPLEAQTLAMYFHTAHYVKRILETFFVHSFSHATMPIFNLMRNCSYYWTFGAVMSYFINHPAYTPVGRTQMLAGFAFSAVMQLSNLRCHIILANLRKDGSKAYVIPSGFLFNYVTCANYCTEIYQWLGFNIATQSAMGYTFMCCGAAQMLQWAIAKHKRLRKLFPGTDGKPKFRRPFILLPPFF